MRIIVFHSTAHAAMAQRLLLECGFCPRLIPQPSSLGQGCGYAVTGQDIDQMWQCLANNHAPRFGFFEKREGVWCRCT